MIPIERYATTTGSPMVEDINHDIAKEERYSSTIALQQCKNHRTLEKENLLQEIRE